YLLKFDLKGYDGAEILKNAEGKTKVVSDIQSPAAEFEDSLKSNVSCRFYIRPYVVSGDIKQYGEETELPPVKYFPKEKIKEPPSGDWWLDD
ncbi:MAG: hypothetical protein J6126_03995, partial [Clostridia bacterium]|nr:hypothetical protein [Clostridia bacterium]